VQAGGEPFGIIRDPAKNKLIHIDVFNETIGLRQDAGDKLRAEVS
jgi:hypothetical protein